jgi:probable rRNA maturation factor
VSTVKRPFPARRGGGEPILVRSDHVEGAAAARALSRLGARFVDALRLGEVQLSIVVTSDRRIRRLNRVYRGKDEVTDVLSFPASPAPLARGQRRPLGDVVISLDIARRRGGGKRRAVAEELSRYLAHGLLHLCGHDHHRSEDARRMARAEQRLLGGAGMLGGSGR